MVHSCPRCELRFLYDAELSDHLEVDHGADHEAFERYRYHPHASDRPATRRYLVVANQTIDSAALAGKLRACQEAGPARFFLLVPATPAVGQGGADEGMARARWRMRQMIERLRKEGVEAEGEVGDPDPFHAVEQVLAHETFDEIIVSTLPAGVSRWLEVDLVQRLQRHCHLPVSTVTSPAPSAR